MSEVQNDQLTEEVIEEQPEVDMEAAQKAHLDTLLKNMDENHDHYVEVLKALLNDIDEKSKDIDQRIKNGDMYKGFDDAPVLMAQGSNEMEVYNQASSLAYLLQSSNQQVPEDITSLTEEIRNSGILAQYKIASLVPLSKEAYDQTVRHVDQRLVEAVNMIYSFGCENISRSLLSLLQEGKLTLESIDEITTVSEKLYTRYSEFLKFAGIDQDVLSFTHKGIVSLIEYYKEQATN